MTAFSEIAANSKDKKLRYYAIAGLGRVGGGNQDATRSLARLLERESAPVFRKAAVEALGQVQMSDEVARTLASALRDSDAGVRAAVARVLGRLDPMHNSALQPRLSLPRELNATTAIPSMDLNITPSIEPTDLR